MEILHTEIQKEYPGGKILLILAVYAVVIGCILTALGFVAFLSKPQWDRRWGIAIGAFLCLLFSLLVLNSGREYNVHHVVLNDTIPYTEIAEKYDFLNQHGKIFILREKQPGN